jgi:hypothetical protein
MRLLSLELNQADANPYLVINVILFFGQNDYLVQEV